MGSFREDVRDQLVAVRASLADNWSDFRQLMGEAWPALLALFVLCCIAIWWADPAPPKKVLLGTGVEGGSFEQTGQQYVDYFARQGITLELVPTAGSEDNIKRLVDHNDPLMAAFVSAGVVPKSDVNRLATLGSFEYLPLWLFYRSGADIDSMMGFRKELGLRVNVGQPGSGTYHQAARVLTLNDVSERSNFSHMSDHDAVDAIRRGDLDAIFIVDSYQSPNVQALLKIPGLKIADYRRAEAYTRLDSTLRKIVIPVGALNLGQNRPPPDLDLIATTAEILIDNRLHPAIQLLFLRAAREINGKESFFSAEGEFPAFKGTGVKRSEEAVLFYEKGSPLLMDYLPFWLAEFFRRTFLAFLPFVAMAYPLIRSMPNYHKNQIRGRINRMYGALKFLEKELITSYQNTDKQAYLARLDQLEREALGMKVPKSVASDYYSLRSSIDFVRNCLLRDGYDAHRDSGTMMSGDNVL